MRGELCESAKRGSVCPDDVCRACEITLCGFNKELYDEVTRDMDDQEPPDWDCEDVE